MSYLKLFRKEALRQQYRSQEFGDSVIQQPLLLDKALWIMLAAVCLLLGLAVVYPFVSTERLSLAAHESNYFPILSPVPIVVERHLHPDGSRINREQIITQVRTFDTVSRTEQVDLIRSNESGVYFSMVNAGTTAQAFQPFAKVLRINDDHLFFFSLSGAKAEQLKPGQLVQLKAGQQQGKGRVHSVIGPFQQGRINVGIQLEPAYDIGILHPSAAVRLELSVKRNNFFALLRGDSK
jgi:hypothetical protein